MFGGRRSMRRSVRRVGARRTVRRGSGKHPLKMHGYGKSKKYHSLDQHGTGRRSRKRVRRRKRGRSRKRGGVNPFMKNFNTP